MERVEPGEYNFTVREVVQETKIILVGEDTTGRDIEMVVASSRRTVPVPYTEEP